MIGTFVSVFLLGFVLGMAATLLLIEYAERNI